MPLEVVDKASREKAAQYVWTLNFGPQHPAMHTTMRLELELEGEVVVKATPHVGYMHSGFEKLGEHLDFNQYVTIVDRMNYISSLSNDIAWHMAVEKLLGVEVTPRCKYIRVIMAELSRITDHFLCVGAAALDLGALTAFVYGFNQRELLYDIFETVCGARLTTSYTRTGGLTSDITDTFVAKVRDFLRDCPKTVDDIARLLNRNRLFVDRTVGIGVLSREDAISWSASGPIARASGVARDLRKDEPYLAYEDFDFKVPVATAGDCYARYMVRLEEIRQSMRIVEQALDNLPDGPVNIDLRDVEAEHKVVLPAKREAYTTIEGLIQHFEMIMYSRGFRTPREEVYFANESPNGELGYYLVGDGSNVAYRARCRPPSFMHFSVFPLMAEGLQLSDMVAIMGSLNLIIAELDR